jgi:hypothetical protein
MTSVQEVSDALMALYTTADDDVRQRANNWLQAFQRSHAAWAMADQLLSTQGLDSQVYFFAAQMLRSKLLYDYRELRGDVDDAAADAADAAAAAADQARVAQCLALRDTVLRHVVAHEKGFPVVRRQLTMCVALLCVLCKEWHQPLPALMQQWGTAHPSILLDVLTALPEEWDNQRLVGG